MLTFTFSTFIILSVRNKTLQKIQRKRYKKMLTKKEIKKAVLKNLGTINLYAKYENLQKHIPMYEKEIQKILLPMVEVYNYQHREMIFSDDIIVEVLKENKEIEIGLQDWYETTNYFIALEIIYKK